MLVTGLKQVATTSNLHNIPSLEVILLLSTKVTICKPVKDLCDFSIVRFTPVDKAEPVEKFINCISTKRKELFIGKIVKHMIMAYIKHKSEILTTNQYKISVNKLHSAA